MVISADNYYTSRWSPCKLSRTRSRPIYTVGTGDRSQLFSRGSDRRGID